MRFVPLLPSSSDPAAWVDLAPVMLDGGSALHPGWPAAVRRGLPVHAVRLPGHAPLDEGLDVLRAGLAPDFLILPAPKPVNREAGFRLLGALEALLEATSGRGTKLALAVEGGAEAAVVDLLRQARGEAVGFCWHPETRDAEALADRLWCGVCAPGSDLKPLQALGYRWDMALPATDPATFRSQAQALAEAHPAVIFPAQMPDTALGRPVVPDAGVTLGRHWERP